MTPTVTWQGRLALGLSVALSAAILAGCQSTEPISLAPSKVAAAPLLVKHGWDIPSPEFVRANVTSMERLPFDGLTISMPQLGDRVQRQVPVSFERFAAELAPVAATRFTSLRHNFVMVYATPAGSFFGDYSVPVGNFANLARAAREAGLVGVAFDNEVYFGSLWDYPADCAGYSLAECQAQAQLRGRQVMDAMRAVWPSVRVLVPYGAWVSEPRTAAVLSPVLRYNDVSWANELMGPFVVGMVESTVGTSARVIDGGEVYTARSVGDFQAVKAWQTSGMAGSSGLVPAGLRSSWPGTVSAGFGVYDQPWIGVGMDVDTWRATVANALATTDEYVWVYTERYDWWGSGWPTTPVPTTWIDATRQARAAVAGLPRADAGVTDTPAPTATG